MYRENLQVLKKKGIQYMGRDSFIASQNQLKFREWMNEWMNSRSGLVS